jgi:hypothetical protein
LTGIILSNAGVDVHFMIHTMLLLISTMCFRWVLFLVYSVVFTTGSPR